MTLAILTLVHRSFIELRTITALQTCFLKIAIQHFKMNFGKYNWSNNILILSVTPISSKRNINRLVFFDYFIILLFYFLLAFTGIFAFEEINDLYTLNFQPDPNEAWYMKVIHYFLSLFPVFTLSTNFPIIAITLRNNLKTLFLTEGKS